MAKKLSANKLKKICVQTISQLLGEIERLSQNLPKDVLADYTVDEKIDIFKIIAKANTGNSIYWSSIELLNKYRWEEHSSELHEDLHLYIRQYNIINKMLEIVSAPEHDEEEIHQSLIRFLNADRVHVLNGYEASTSRFLKEIKFSPRIKSKPQGFWGLVKDEEEEPKAVPDIKPTKYIL